MTRERVAIVGGGCGGVAAAYWLSSTAALRARFEVTLYTHGWRLGGKAASGRNLSDHNRIEEHGLHLWLGCYRRAFQLMREVLAADPEPGPSPDFATLFLPIRDVTLMERDGDPWAPWTFRFNRRPGYPDDRGAVGLADLIIRFTRVLEAFLDENLPGVVGEAPYREALRELRMACESGLISAAQMAAEQLRMVNVAIVAAIENRLVGLVVFPIAEVFGWDAWRSLILANLGIAMATGLAADILASPDGPEAAKERLDRQDYRAWLGSHLALPASLDSAPVRGLYDLAFAYPCGDTSRRGELAAGAGFGLVLDMIDYRGAAFYRMNGGMGDVIFGPLHRVLLKQGVRVEFFHRLVGVSPDGAGAIQQVTFARQVRIKSGDYRPFVEVNGEACWPTTPDWDQLVDGDKLRAANVNFEDSTDETNAGDFPTLVKGASNGFDHLILAVPPETLKATTEKLNHPRWREMLQFSVSVATQAFQLWINAPTAATGWRSGVLMSTYEQPFATWADMTHLLAKEDWNGPGAPRSVHYFCGPMLEGFVGNPVHWNVDTWTGEALDSLWAGPPPDDLTISRYDRANTDRSERYVQAPPNSIAHRLRPGESPYANLALAGDWTRMDNSGGCVENAMASGLLAARKISGDRDLGGP